MWVTAGGAGTEVPGKGLFLQITNSSLAGKRSGRGERIEKMIGRIKQQTPQAGRA